MRRLYAREAKAYDDFTVPALDMSHSTGSWIRCGPDATSRQAWWPVLVPAPSLPARSSSARSGYVYCPIAPSRRGRNERPKALAPATAIAAR